MKIPEKDDLVSRKEAIDMLTRSSIYSLSTEDDQAAHSWAIRVIEMLPSKDKTTCDKWIPCSERLPKECDGHVFVSREDGQVTIGLHSEFSNVWYIGDMCGVGGCKVIAWMPLPAPYRKDNKI